MTPLERFWNKVNFQGPGLCWLWTASKFPNGYGQFQVDGKPLKAHRWAYEHFVGPIPKGLELDHLCRVRNCVNPRHLEPVKHQENIRRSPIHKKTCRKNGRKVGLASRKYDLPEGVSPAKNKKNPFRAQIRLNGEKVYLGVFSTPKLASEAYQKARRTIRG